MKTCKNCIYSKIIIPKNTNCPSEFVCSLSDEDFHDCISNDMSHFSSKILDQSLKDATNVFTRKEELSKEESEWLIDFITKEGGAEE